MTATPPDRLDRIEALLIALADRQEATQQQLDRSIEVGSTRAETIFLAIAQLTAQQQSLSADLRSSVEDLVSMFSTLSVQVGEMQSEVRGLQTENRRILDILQNRTDDRD